MALLRKQPVDEIATAEQKVADLSQQIIAATSAFETAEAAATAAALSGDGLDEAVSVAAQASVKLRAFEPAKTLADARVVELRKQKLDADNAARREQAVTQLNEWRDEAIEVRRALLPLVKKVRELCVAHDSTVAEYGRGVLRPFLDPMNAVLLAPDTAQEGFSGLGDLIARNDLDADILAARVLNYAPHPLAPVE